MRSQEHEFISFRFNILLPTYALLFTSVTNLLSQLKNPWPSIYLFIKLYTANDSDIVLNLVFEFVIYLRSYSWSLVASLVINFITFSS